MRGIEMTVLNAMAQGRRDAEFGSLICLPLLDGRFQG